MNTFLIFAVIMIILGIIIIYSAFNMKKTKTINHLFLADEERETCAKPEEFIQYISPRVFVFGVGMIFIGICGVLSDSKLLVIPFWHIIQLIIFVILFGVFAYQMRKAKKDFVFGNN